MLFVLRKSGWNVSGGGILNGNLDRFDLVDSYVATDAGNPVENTGAGFPLYFRLLNHFLLNYLSISGFWVLGVGWFSKQIRR